MINSQRVIVYFPDTNGILEDQCLGIRFETGIGKRLLGYRHMTVWA